MRGKRARAPAVREVPSIHKPDEDVIGALREVLAQAERGEVVAVCIAAQCTDLRVHTHEVVGPNGQIAHLVLGIENLKLRLLGR